MKWKNYRRIIRLSMATAALALLPIQNVFANVYNLPLGGNALIGDVAYTSTWWGDSLVKIGQRNNIGVNAMQEANPTLSDNVTLPSGSYVKIPAKFILPPLARRGIVINLAEMRMYYYPDDSNSVMTFPIGIGRVGKTIPMGATSITRKTINPTWIPPEDIREYNRQQGIELPYAMGPGPDNPLGPYAIYLKVPTFLIHSTIFPESIGRRASFGCIRMYEGDIKQFYPMVQPGTPVAIVNIPSKVGWEGNQLFLETHPQLEEHTDSGAGGIIATIDKYIPHHGVTLVNWQAVSYLADQRDGIPHEIGIKVK